MTYGENNYSINLEDNKHLDRIKELIKMYDKGVTVDVFSKFTQNINNYFKSYDDSERTKSLEEWEAFFSQFVPKEVELSKEHIELLFHYLQKAGYGGSLIIKANSIRSNLEHMDFKVQCKLEYIVLKTLELTNKEL
ncbi:MAG: hypothetical protein RJQ00_02755 [Vicingaceae bacterium]